MCIRDSSSASPCGASGGACPAPESHLRPPEPFGGAKPLCCFLHFGSCPDGQRADGEAVSLRRAASRGPG
eukprot:8320783-Alexandrium_andersonii.AAC.1